MTRAPVIAIDGPAASGKSSTAAAVARRLGVHHLDSGALYRAVALVALEGECPQGDPAFLPTLWEALERREVRLARIDGEVVPFVDGAPAGEAIRSAAVTALVSPLSAVPAVRAWVDARLRAMVEGLDRPVVLDGRDIGTAVFPDAELKVFLDATPEVRARRRILQRAGGDGRGGKREEADEIAVETARLVARDHQDRTRAVAPLRQAADAVYLDTSAVSFEEQVARIVALVRRSPLLAGLLPR